MKRAIWFMIACFVLLLGSAFILHMMIDQNKIRQHVVRSLREQTGLELQMDHADFEILPWPSFHAHSIRLMRPHCAPFITAQSVHADISLLKLFRREFSFQNFTAEGAWISFHKSPHNSQANRSDNNSDSAANCATWFPFLSKELIKEDKAIKEKLPIKEVAGKWHVGDAVEAKWKVSFDSLHLSDSRLFWQNETILDSDTNKLNESLYGGELDIESLDLAGLKTQNPWINFHGVYHGHNLELKGHIGHLTRLFRLSHAHERPWSFSLGMIWGNEKEKGTMMIDGLFREPALLQGGEFSLQGTLPSIEEKSFLSSLFLPSLSHYSFKNVQIVVAAKDRRLNDISQNSKKNLYKNANFQEILKLFSDNLTLNMFHIKANQGHIKGSKDLILSDIILDAASIHLPVLGQANISLDNYQWYGRFHFESLEKMQALFQTVQEGVPDGTSEGTSEGIAQGKDRQPLAFTASIEGRKNNLDSLSFFQKKSLSDDKSDDKIIERDVLLNLKGKLGHDGLICHLIGDAEDINFPLGKKTAFSSPHLHHAHLETDLEFSFLHDFFAVPHFDLKSDEARLEANGVRDHHHLQTEFIIKNLDIEKLFHVKSKEENNQKSIFFEKIKENKRSAKEEFNHLMNKIKLILQDWQWDIIIKGDNIDYGHVAYDNILINSSLSGGGLQNSFSGFWKEKENTLSYPLSGTMSIIPTDKDDLRLSLASEAPKGSIFIPFSWIDLLLGGTGQATGLVQFVGSLSAQGHDWRGIKKSLNGEIGLAVVNGGIEKSLLTPFMGAASSLLKLDSDIENLRCLVGHSQIEDGKMSIDKIILQMGKLSLLGYGDVSLSDDRLTMFFTPHIDIAGHNIVTPLAIEGHFSDPKMRMMSDIEVSSLKNNGKENGDICLEPLNEVRQGAFGPNISTLKPSSSVGTILHSLGL